MIVKISLKVLSNEVEDKSTAFIKTTESFAGGVAAAKVFIVPSKCNNEGTSNNRGDLCVADNATNQRFYTISVEATDDAGWTSKDACRVIVMPRLKEGETTSRE